MKKLIFAISIFILISSIVSALNFLIFDTEKEAWEYVMFLERKADTKFSDVKVFETTDAKFGLVINSDIEATLIDSKKSELQDLTVSSFKQIKSGTSQVLVDPF
jgi:hypothetical protein